MKKRTNQNEISKTWQLLPCAIFIAFFNVFAFGTLESNAQILPQYTAVLNDVTYAGNQATLSYTVSNTSLNTIPTGCNGIRWKNVMSTFPPVQVSIQNLAGFAFSYQETGSIPGTNIKIYDVNLIPTIDIHLRGGFRSAIKFKIGTPDGVTGEIHSQPMECRFEGGGFVLGADEPNAGSWVFEPYSWWENKTEGLLFPIDEPELPGTDGEMNEIVPIVITPVVIDHMYVSGENLAFNLKQLTLVKTINTIESAGDLSKPNWTTEMTFVVGSTNQTVTLPLADIEAGHCMFRIRSAEKSDLILQ